MVEKKEAKKDLIEEKKDFNQQKRDIFKIWADSNIAVLRTWEAWEDSYINLYKLWIESSEEMFKKAVELTNDSAPKKYKEFYDEWIKFCQNTFGKFYPIPTPESNKEILEKLLSCASESNKFYKSWIDRLEENSKKTQEILQGDPDPAKYKECYDMWMKSYDKIFDELLELPAMEGTKDIFENYTGIQDIYLASFVQLSKLWKNSYVKPYGPWIESMFKLSGKIAEISRGDVSPEVYKEFYSLWLNTYQETYGKLFDVQSMKPSKEVFENFSQSTNIYLNMYKSWIAALEKMSEKSQELSKESVDLKTYKEFYNLWTKTYEKAFDSFFDDMPTIGPMKEMMEPVKNAAKIYSDTFAKMSEVWVKSDFDSHSHVQLRNIDKL